MPQSHTSNGNNVWTALGWHQTAIETDSLDSEKIVCHTAFDMLWDMLHAIMTGITSSREVNSVLIFVIARTAMKKTTHHAFRRDFTAVEASDVRKIQADIC